MIGRLALLSTGLICLVSGPLYAGPPDGMLLLVSQGAAPGEVVLQWSGGQPDFTIYRSTDKAQIVGPTHQIGVSPVRSWNDTPPPGQIFYYEITSPCVYAPPEICNNYDDDCDGTIDEGAGCPGSPCGTPADCGSGFCVDGICCNSACTPPNAETSCATGTCAVVSCHTGFGDCDLDPANGCEIDTTTDAAHCGACGTSCDDNSPCTNDLCVASSCRRVDRTRCANINAGGGNPGGASCGPQGCGACNFAQAFPGCEDADTDGDGLGDTWEEAGAIDLDCDGDYDANDVAIPDADKRVKDVYLKASAMANSPEETGPAVHKPPEEAVRRVVAAFAGSHLSTPPVRCDDASPACPPGFTCALQDFVCLPACVNDADCASGVCDGGMCRQRRLHFDYAAINLIPHRNVVTYGPVQAGCLTGGDTSQGVNFFDLKADPANFDTKKALFTRFGVFGHFQSCDSPSTCADDDPSDGAYCPDVGGSRPDFSASGLAELSGNDWMVTLGGYPITADPEVTILRFAGATMHEMGHGLGLNHGGPDCDPLTDPTCTYAPEQPRKPNHLSIMNHLYNFGIPVATTPGSVTPDPKWTRMDFSHGQLTGTLDETNLSEEAGVAPGIPSPFDTDLVKYFSPGFGTGTRYGSTMPGEPINWKIDDPVTSSPVQVNINGFPPGIVPSETHTGADEWSHLEFDFQCQPTFLDGAPPPPGRLAVAEITPQIAAEVDALLPLLKVRTDVQAECLDISTNGAAVPDVLYGSASLDVQQVDLQTLRLSEAPPLGVSFNDEDGDGYLDLKATYRPQQMSLSVQSHLVVLTGKLVNGQSLQGEDAVVVTIGQCCPAGQVFCPSGCTTLSSDPDNCGACGQSCSSANMQTRTCTGGACTGTCLTGYGDCNADLRADGCESDLHVAQSTSPAFLWASDPNPDKDLKPGYLRVAGITNCGGCGVTCDDAMTCTSDLCVPVGPAGAQVGTCRHFDRAQCGEARCGTGVLPPGTPAPRNPECIGPDADGDSLPGAWETPQGDPYTGATNPLAGIDLDCDGEISDADQDLIWHEPPAGDGVKDVYLEYDTMGPGSGEPIGHAPLPESVDAVVSAFARAGVVLHVDPVHQEMPHAGVLYLPVPGPDPDPCASAANTDFFLYKSNPLYHDPRRRLGYRYGLFAHDSCCASGAVGCQASGLAEIRGNDFVVSLGSFTYPVAPAEAHDRRVMEEAGTLMHEVGHTLGLDHGGPAGDPGSDAEKKPNHISSMSYQFQLAGILRSGAPGTVSPLDPALPRRVDFSYPIGPVPPDPLDENNLDETTGLAVPTPPFNQDVTRYFCPGGVAPRLAPAEGPIDWNCDQQLSPSVAADVDRSGGLEALAPADDEWGALSFDFQCQPTLADGAAPASYAARDELALADATSLSLRADSTAHCDPGFDDCDGNPENGCETPTDSDPVNCGECGIVCQPGLECTSGECTSGSTGCSADSLWSAPLGSGVPSAPTNDTAFNPSGGSFSYIAQGTTVWAVYNTTVGGNPAGSVAWSRAFPATVIASPVPVLLKSGAEAIFVTATNGFVYRLDASTGADALGFAPFDTRRLSCPADQIIATPAVQLYQYSNSAFKSAYADDLVYVITRYVSSGIQCLNADQQNRIIALTASNGVVAWTLNPGDLGLPMSYGSNACELDYATNTIYCATNTVGGQDSLWAIRTAPDGPFAAGTRKWSTAAGSIVARPILHGGNVHVATLAGNLDAFDAATGAAVYLANVTGGSTVTRNFAIAGNSIYLTDSAGFLHKRIEDLTAVCAFPFPCKAAGAGGLWPVDGTTEFGAAVTTAPAVVPGLGKVWVGTSDGRVHQIDLATGADEGYGTVGIGPLSDPALDVEGGSPQANRLVIAAGGQMKRYCLPWPYGSMGTSALSPPGVASGEPIASFRADANSD